MWNQVTRQLVGSNNFKFFEDEETITIEATSEVVDRLKDSISSRVATRQLLQSFAIGSKNDSSEIKYEREAEQISLLPLEKIQNKEVFSRLFQDALEGSTIATTNGNVEWDSEKSTDAILFSQAKVVTQRQLTVYKVQVQAMQILLATTNLTVLRSTFSDGPMPTLVEEDKPGPIANMVNKIIGVTEENVENEPTKKSVRIYFDCKRLLGLLTCFNYNRESDSRITIDKQSLIDFLAASLPQSLAISQDEMKPLIAEPKDSKAVKLPHDFHLVVDCSGSIGDLKPYFEKIATIVNEVSKITPEQMIHTTLFDSKVEEQLPMRADSQIYLQNLLNQIFKFGGQTYLVGTLLKVLEKVETLLQTGERYTSVVVITDGDDTHSSKAERRSLESRISNFSKTTNPPQFTFVQIGTNTNRDFFDRFTKATSGVSVDLKDPSSFAPLYARIKDLAAEKGDIREFLDQQSRVLATVRPVLGALTPLDLKLPKTGFSFGKRGQEATLFNFK